MTWIDIPSESCGSGDVPPTNALMTTLRDNGADTKERFSGASPIFYLYGHGVNGEHSWLGYYYFFTRWYQPQSDPSSPSPDISVAGNKVAYAFANSYLPPTQDMYLAPPTLKDLPGLAGTNAGCILSQHYFARRGGNGYRIEALDLTTLVSDPETATLIAGGYAIGDTA